MDCRQTVRNVLGNTCRRGTAWRDGRVGRYALSLVVLAAGCRDVPTSTVRRGEGERTGLVTILLSSVSASKGERIAVRLHSQSTHGLGALQGTLSFDPTRLRYAGQSMDEAGVDLVLVNAEDASTGALRVGAINARGMSAEIGPLVFEVVAEDYATGLGFNAEAARTTTSTSEPPGQVRLAGSSVTLVASSVPADARPLTADDWLARLEPRATRRWATFSVPGQVVPGLVYGDVDLSGGSTPIGLGDVILPLAVSVGLVPMIVGSDNPAIDAVIAANVHPANVGTGLPPGFEAPTNHGVIGIDDALAIANHLVGNPVPLVGTPIRPVPTQNRVLVSGNITTNTTWSSAFIYELQGPVRVTSSATLTITSGTRIEGQRGSAPGLGGGALIVERDGRLVAVGTPALPIVFTCAGLPSQAPYRGCWGGVAISGNATLNEGSPTSPIIAGRASAGGCNEQLGVAVPTVFGGCNDDDNSGTLRFVRVEYGGSALGTAPAPGLALWGVGRGTVLDYVQVHAGLEDGIEVVGGTANLTRLLLTASGNDAFAWNGWTGNVQFVIVQQDSLHGDLAFEGQNSPTQPDALPRSQPVISNVTLVGANSAGSTHGTPGNNLNGMFRIRRGTRPTITNVLGEGFPYVLRCDDVSTAAAPFVMQHGRFLNNSTAYASNGTCPVPYNGASLPLTALWSGNGFSGAVIGTVTSSVAGGMPGVQITVTPSGGPAEPTVTTDASGWYAQEQTRVGSGSGTVTVSGLPPSCLAPSGPFPYSGLTAGGTVTVDVTVFCSPNATQGTVAGTAVLPPLGGLITITPSGGSPLSTVPIEPGGNWSRANVPPGSGTVTLGGIAGNCFQPSPATYSGLTAGGTLNVSLGVSCFVPGPTGTLLGSLIGTDGVGIMGAIVSLIPSGGLSLPPVTTSAGGLFTVTGIPANGTGDVAVLQHLPSRCDTGVAFSLPSVPANGSVPFAGTLRCAALRYRR